MTTTHFTEGCKISPDLMTQASPTTTKKPNYNWRTLAILTIYSAYFYAFMEWIFFVTKPSSFSILTLFEKIKILAVTSGIVALILLACVLILAIPALFVRDPNWHPRLRYLTYLPSAVMLSITALIMLDNFTYTVFNYGIISTGGIWRAVYALGFLVLTWWVSRQIKHRTQKRRTPSSFPALGLLIVSLAFILPIVFSHNTNLNGLNKDALKPSAKRPNIIILGGDGLSAKYLSVYGFEKDTTPFLKKMAKTSLVAENAFPNASSTTASTTTMMTGREPITVKVYRYPDVLKGNDSFEHLPGILKREGYTTVEVGTPYYVDAQELNLLDGFDIVNNQSLNQPTRIVLQKILGNSPSTQFIWTINERASERLLHIFFIQEMKNPLKEVNNPEATVNDKQRVKQILDAVDHAQSDHPVYVFAHLMDTHGPHFSSDKQVFSSSSTDQEWNKDQYEDAILSYDGSVRTIYDHLAETGQLDNTIIVIYTDHGFQYTVWSRIPIIVHFPNGTHAGTRKNNLQIIDVPATLLDYLSIAQPTWMTGTSFLNNEPPADRQIVSIVAGSPSKIKPPFYQIKIVQVLVCKKWYTLNVQENSWDTGLVSDYKSNCGQTLLPADNEIHKIILDYLEQYGYDISSLK